MALFGRATLILFMGTNSSDGRRTRLGWSGIITLNGVGDIVGCLLLQTLAQCQYTHLLGHFQCAHGINRVLRISSLFYDAINNWRSFRDRFESMFKLSMARLFKLWSANGGFLLSPSRCLSPSKMTLFESLSLLRCSGAPLLLLLPCSTHASSHFKAREKQCDSSTSPVLYYWQCDDNIILTIIWSEYLF